MKTVLLTGATGYLGGWILNMLLERGYSVIALCLSHNEELHYNSIYGKNVKIYFLDTDELNVIFEKNTIDIVIHTATLYGRKNEDLSSILRANVEFPLRILALAISHKVGVFINTDTILVKNISSYSLSKRQFVDWLDMFADQIKVINLRLDHFYGPNDKPIKFVAWLIEQFKSNVKNIDLTEGSQTRDFVYIRDVVEAYKIVLNNLDRIPVGRRNNFEVGTGLKTSIREFVFLLKKMMNNTETKLNFGAIPYRKNEVLDYDIDTTALRLLGWEPQYNVEEGLNDIVSVEGLRK